MTSRWNFGDWGAACGPRPTGPGAAAGTVVIAQQGGELAIGESGRTYSTTECWEQYPGLSRVGHVGGTRGWRTVCRTQPTDPRQASIITTISATDTAISFDETGQYQFVIEGQNCTASVRRSRTFRLLQRVGEAPPSPVSSPSAAVPEAEAPQVAGPSRPPGSNKSLRCEQPGPPARLEVRPSRKLMRPGERFAFRSLVLDAHGCTLRKVFPAWRLVEPNSPARFVSPGLLAINDDAPETEVALTASVRGQSVRVVVEIASKERYEALLRRGGFDESGESQQTAAAAIASGSLGARTTVTQGEPPARRYLLAAVIGAAAVALAGLGLVIVRRGRQRGQVTGSTSPAAVAGPEMTVPYSPMSTVGLPCAGPSAPAPPRPQKICPVCGERFDPDAQFCGVDGATLVPEN
ncbi:MAG: hypothetical protein JW940_34745 [Polyangiaceae bacterium]|nr:hypothetical protein [Polyangiaceae bacterium]